MTGIPIPIARMAYYLGLAAEEEAAAGTSSAAQLVQEEHNSSRILLYCFTNSGFWEVGERESQFIPKKRRFSKNSSLVGRHCIFYHGELRCNGLPATRRGPSR